MKERIRKAMAVYAVKLRKRINMNYEGKINLSTKLEHFPVSRLNGPGMRYIIYTQGCAHPCTNECLNPENITQDKRVLYSDDEIVNYIQRRRKKETFEGVTFLGGEPFDQANNMGELARKCQKNGLTVMTYSGMTYEYLKNANRPDYEQLLAFTDILIDGPFIPEQYDKRLLWRGSKNQRIILLSSVYSRAQIFEQENVVKGANILISFNDNLVHYTGKQHADDSREKQFVHRFLEQLRKEVKD